MTDPYPSRHLSSPAIARRQDPVLHASDLADAPIPASLCRQYETEGVLVLENVLQAEEVAALKAETDRLREMPDALEKGTVITEPDSDNEDSVRSVFAVHKQSAALGALAADQRLAGMARFLLNDDVYLHQSRVNYKPAFRGKEFYWHSDFETWHTEDGMPRMRALSMSVMLTDNHPQAGPTMFIPGSQNNYVQCVGETPDDHYKASLRRQEYGVPDHGSLRQLVEDGGIIAPAPPAGSVVIFDCNIMHGSNGNITPMERVNAFFVFNAWSNRLIKPFGQTQPRPEFIAHRRVKSPLPGNARRQQRAA